MKSRFFLRLVRPFVRRKFRNSFENVRIWGEESFLQQLQKGPLIVASNHVTFWDALLLIFLDERWGGGGHALMDAKNLGELPFFAHVGAVPIHRGRPRKSLADLKASLQLLRGPSDYLVIFPQGHERPLVEPLKYLEGVHWLSKMAQVPVVPMALRYDFGVSERPFLHVALGEPVSHSESLLAELETRTMELSRLVDEELIRINRGENGLVFNDAWKRPAPSDRPLGARILARLFSRGRV